MKKKFPLLLKLIIGFVFFIVILALIGAVFIESDWTGRIISGIIMIFLLVIGIGLTERSNFARKATIGFFLFTAFCNLLVWLVGLLSINLFGVIFLGLDAAIIFYLMKPEIKKLFTDKFD